MDDTSGDHILRFDAWFRAINDAVFVCALTPKSLPSPFLDFSDVARKRLGDTRDELCRMPVTDITDGRNVDVRGLLGRLQTDRGVILTPEPGQASVSRFLVSC